MNYYDARPLKDGSGWHYTCCNDGRIWPVGYCGGAPGNGSACEPCPPHATADEARECFGRYLLNGQRLETYGDWTGCEARVDGERCDTPTKHGLTTRPPLGHGFALCDEHRTSEQLEALTPAVGQIVASY